MVQRCWIMRLQIVLLQNRWDIQMCPPHVNCITTATKIIRPKSIRSAKQLTFRKRNTKEQKYISMKVWERSKIKACRDLRKESQAVRFSHPLLNKSLVSLDFSGFRDFLLFRKNQNLSKNQSNNKNKGKEIADDILFLDLVYGR